MAKFRPQQHVLDVFWTLSDGNDDQRSNGVVKLARMIKTSEESEKGQLLQYCQERLVRGLSSGRKFARVGFSVALVHLLRENEEMDTHSVLSTIKNKLPIGGSDKKLQSEISSICLGKTFAISALIQANRVDQLSGGDISSMVEELFSIADKKSYLKAVCDNVIQDLIQQMPADVFREHVWPLFQDKMSQGWQQCTLDRVAVLLMCRARFPDVVTKKFLRKHWGFPVLSEANDDKLLTAVMTSVQQSDILVEQILPQMLESGRDAHSIWMTVGEKLLEHAAQKPGKTMSQQQQLGLKFAAKLLSIIIQDEQAVDVLLSPGLARYVFNSDNKRSHPGTATDADYLYQQICQRLTCGKTSVLGVIERVWKLEAALSQQQHSGRAELVKCNKLLHFFDLMPRDEADQYSHVLVAMIMGNDEWNVLSHDPPTKLKQIECCLRHLQHLSSSQSCSMADRMQNSILALFLRLAYFHVTTAIKKIEHCGSCINLQETDTARRLSEVFFHKALDSIFTHLAGQQKKWKQLSGCLDMLYGLACYVQVLLDSEAVVPIKFTQLQVQVEWRTLVDFCTKLRQSHSESQGLHSAFVLLALFLGFHMLTDVKMAVDLLQDVYVCCKKAGGEEQEESTNDDNEPQWIEVLTELLLKIMSFQSHLGRVIAAIVFRLLSAHITPNAVALITEVLIPSKSAGDDTGAVLVDADDDDDNFHDEDEEVSNISNSDDNESEDEASSTDVSEDNESEDEPSIRDVSDQDTKTGVHYLEEEESLSDLSDSEMFKMDAMLAEVFRQRQKSGGKKAKAEKQQELINFQIRVLDLVEVVIKGERCGDFVFNLLKPLCLLMIKSTTPRSQILAERAKSLFMLIKSKTKALNDSVHSIEDQRLLFIELLNLASKVTDKIHLQEVSAACYMLTSIHMEHPQLLVSSRPCVELVMNALEKGISKKSSKPHVAFFNMLLECDPIQFQDLGPKLVDRLKDESVRLHGRMICCLVLASLCKKTDSVQDTDLLAMKLWMTEAANVVRQMMFSLDKVMFYKDILTLVAALQTRQDIFSTEVLFGAEIREHLMAVKSKFNTDIRRLANRVISSIDKQSGQLKSATKRKTCDSTLSSTQAHKKVFM